MNVIPKVSIDPTTKRTFYTFQSTLQQSVHKQIYQSSKFVLLLGGGAGATFSQASPSGTNVNIAASFTLTPGFQLSPKWGIIIPVQGIYTVAGWDLVPAVAVVFKP